MQGWIRLHRELLDKPIWLESTPEQKTILITLIMMASHKENEWEWKGEKFKIQPGQFITSLESIARKAGKGISIQNVRTSINRLEKYGFLTNESTNKNRLITIVNWRIYQTDEDSSNKQTNKQLTSNQQATNNYQECKNVKNEKERTSSIQQVEQFESWWNLYGKKEGKKKCQDKFLNLLKKIDYQTIEDGTKRYLEHREHLKTIGEFVPQQKNPLTFLNGEHFKDEYNTIQTQTTQTTQTQIYKPLEVDYNRGEDW